MLQITWRIQSLEECVEAKEAVLDRDDAGVVGYLALKISDP
jgi:hypothetical protein